SVNVEPVIVSARPEPATVPVVYRTAPPAWPEALFAKTVLLIVRLPSGLQLIPAPLLAPLVQLPETTASDRVSESLAPPPRLAPPPNAWAAPLEMVTPEMLTATLPTPLGSSSNTRAVPAVQVAADCRIVVVAAPAPLIAMLAPAVVPTCSSPSVRLWVPAG